MIRLLVIAAIISVGCKMVLGKWPWDYLRGPDTKGQALFKARKLLGVPERATHAEIIEAHRRLITMIHPDKGGTNEQVHEANDARDLLLNDLPHQGEGQIK
ncbi:J domain-containing protein [Altererythrobacter sp. MF3-039]|uniref:J domain-containing protein n=1 Tax=Altererythrobacter sp. MF3-039 TaxID=3252901 RepID=UPI00390C6C4E